MPNSPGVQILCLKAGRDRGWLNFLDKRHALMGVLFVVVVRVHAGLHSATAVWCSHTVEVLEEPTVSNNNAST